jgi:hypothetical protein
MELQASHTFALLNFYIDEVQLEVTALFLFFFTVHYQGSFATSSKIVLLPLVLRLF